MAFPHKHAQGLIVGIDHDDLLSGAPAERRWRPVRVNATAMSASAARTDTAAMEIAPLQSVPVDAKSVAGRGSVAGEGWVVAPTPFGEAMP